MSKFSKRFADKDLSFITIDNGICNKCKNIFADGVSCKAFPKNIPFEILNGKFDHHKPFKGDNGIQFEAR